MAITNVFLRVPDDFDIVGVGRVSVFSASSSSRPAPPSHISAPIFYKVFERSTVTGTVTEFRFNNPHAISKFDAAIPTEIRLVPLHE